MAHSIVTEKTPPLVIKLAAKAKDMLEDQPPLAVACAAAQVLVRVALAAGLSMADAVDLLQHTWALGPLGGTDESHLP